MIPVQYLISADQRLPILKHIKYALKAGCRWIQIQTNGNGEANLQKTLQKAKEICRENQATLIIEDDIQLVKAIDGDGVHITDGTSIAEVRQQIGDGYLIGANARNAEEVIQKKKQSADYICCGPFQGQSSQKETDEVSLEDYTKLIDQLAENGIFLPVCATGNIYPKDVYPILQTGIRGIAIHIDNPDVQEEQIKNTLNAYINA